VGIIAASISAEVVHRYLTRASRVGVKVPEASPPTVENLLIQIRGAGSHKISTHRAKHPLLSAVPTAQSAAAREIRSHDVVPAVQASDCGHGVVPVLPI
jgi:hypothetical protein